MLEGKEEIKERYLEHFTDILQPPKAEEDEEKAQEEVINLAFENIIYIASKQAPVLTTLVKKLKKMCWN